MAKEITPKQAVAEQIAAMLTNNIVCENGNESFVGWCEDGDVFYASYEGRSEEFYEECARIMNEVEQSVDAVTNIIAEH